MEYPDKLRKPCPVSFNLQPMALSFSFTYTFHLSTSARNFITLSCSLCRVGIILQSSVNGLDKW